MTNASASPESVKRAEQALLTFLQLNKSKIGISKSTLFNESLVRIALKDNELLEFALRYADEVEKYGEQALSKRQYPHLVTFFRGIKSSQKYVIQALRKAIYKVFSQETLNQFDSMYTEHHFLSIDDKEGALWDHFGAYLAKDIQTKDKAFVYDAFLKPFFHAILQRIETAGDNVTLTGASVSSKELPSVHYQYKDKFKLDTIFRLFNESYSPHEFEEETPEYDTAVARYLEEAHKLVSKFCHGKMATTNAIFFISQAVADDAPKKDDSIEVKFMRARDLGYEIGRKKTAADKSMWKSQKKTAKTEINELTNEHEDLSKQIQYFARGVLLTLDTLIVGESKRAAQTYFNASREFYDIVQKEDFNSKPFAHFFKKIILKMFMDDFNTRFLRLILDLRGEGVIKDFNESSYSLRVEEEHISFNIDMYIKKNVKYVKIARSLLRMNENLEEALISCPSIAHPLAVNFSRVHQKDKRASKNLIMDNRLAFVLGRIIHVDYVFKSYSSNQFSFFRLIIQNIDNNNFISFLATLATTSPKIKNMLLSNPLIIRTIWTVESGNEGLGFFEHIIKSPIDLEQIKDTINDPKELAAMLNHSVSKLKEARKKAS